VREGMRRTGDVAVRVHDRRDAVRCDAVAYLQPYDPITSDIWSLCVVLYVMITGEYPFSRAQLRDHAKQLSTSANKSLLTAEHRSLCGSQAFVVMDSVFQLQPRARASLQKLQQLCGSRPSEHQRTGSRSRPSSSASASNGGGGSAGGGLGKSESTASDVADKTAAVCIDDSRASAATALPVPAVVGTSDSDVDANPNDGQSPTSSAAAATATIAPPRADTVTTTAATTASSPLAATTASAGKDAVGSPSSRGGAPSEPLVPPPRVNKLQLPPVKRPHSQARSSAGLFSPSAATAAPQAGDDFALASPGPQASPRVTVATAAAATTTTTGRRASTPTSVGVALQRPPPRSTADSGNAAEAKTPSGSSSSRSPRATPRWPGRRLVVSSQNDSDVNPAPHASPSVRGAPPFSC
jgi:hypothetical protein